MRVVFAFLQEVDFTKIRFNIDRAKKPYWVSEAACEPSYFHRYVAGKGVEFVPTKANLKWARKLKTKGETVSPEPVLQISNFSSYFMCLSIFFFLNILR